MTRSKEDVVAGWSQLSLDLLKWDDPRIQARAIGNLRHLASVNSEHRDKLMAAGALPIVIQLLRADSVETQEQAACALKCLGFGNTNYQSAIIESGALEVLVDMLNKDKTPVIQKEAAGVLRFLAQSNAQHRKAVSDAGAIPLLIPLLSVPMLQENAAGALRNLVHNNTPNEMELVRLGGVPPLVDVLRTNNIAAQEQAAGTLKALTMKNHAESERAIMEAGGMDIVVKLLQEGALRVKQQAAGMVANLVDRMVEYLITEDAIKQEKGVVAICFLAAFGAEERKAIFSEGALEPLLDIVKQILDAGKAPEESPLLLLSTTTALRNLTTEPGEFARTIVGAGLLDLVPRLLVHEDKAVMLNGIAMLRNMIDDSTGEFHDYVIKLGVVPVLVGHLNIIEVPEGGDQEEEDQDKVKSEAGVPQDEETGQTQVQAIKEQAAGAIACLASVYRDFRIVIERDFAIPPLVELLQSDDFGCKMQAAIALKFMSQRYADSIVGLGGLNILEDIFKKTTNPQLKQVALDALKAMGAA
eukprot:TRINITY_DN2552_c3_g1_i1.p1 TRINITY_DN2552_c3_g1~~TRINITY_DN2552_c3_g1_i1.p1  ORF type:complete len:542 (-),score=131.15 TRINITY_DN2552_c3_g1_i1:170-1753(-)